MKRLMMIFLLTISTVVFAQTETMPETAPVMPEPSAAQDTIRKTGHTDDMRSGNHKLKRKNKKSHGKKQKKSKSRKYRSKK